MVKEPSLDASDIQGHVLPGFGTRYLRMLGLKITAPGAFKESIQPWLDDLTDLAFANNKRLARRDSYRKTGKRPDDPAVLMAMVFSSAGLQSLGMDIAALKDRRFRRGMAFDAPEFNDESDADGTPIGWEFGDTEATTPDVLVLCGCELYDPLCAYSERLLGSLESASQLIADQWGDRPDNDKEHFGFKDGVSQPAVRGMLKATEYLFRRDIAPEDRSADLYSKPGRPLVWPGQFVFGYPGQSTDPLRPGTILDPGAAWMRNGSYLVLRRLRQDVKLFRAAVADQSERLGQQHGVEISDAALMAKLVGRWPDGTPLVTSPNGPDAEISGDSTRINHFNFATPAPAVALRSGDVVSGVADDLDGLMCPHLAHIRKINPRDGITAIGTELTLSKMILRRGINFGKPYDDDPADERGLLFMCYQTSISNQFVFLQKNWANTDDRPTVAGHDFVIGQTTEADNLRQGMMEIEGRRCPISINGEWVKMTGGGYFAVPGIEGVRQILKQD